ncbi:T9SS type B sorting domain-containing protein [Aquimarina sediminis]|uniref:T9SS type B sorting domain-containing protein n=1 Tax=Aquimarina sediminis TaxID=2070536 RepID=UPI000CA01A3A|nr:T9SS type B sorting domain-containing protein [Aquimarina sediminis]
MKKKLLSTIFLISIFFIGHSQNEPTDCTNAVIVCGDTNLELNSNGTGINDFAISGNNPPDCNFAESQSLWLRVNIVQSGTLAFTITPESTNADEDYDFAVYGPNVTCTSLGSSIRCSSTNPPAASVPTVTGLNDTETDLSEGPGDQGNGFVRAIDALAGEEYFILIDNFSQNGGFDLEFTGTAILPDSPINTASTTTPLDLTECDAVGDSTDGRTNFNLDSNTPIILGTQTNTVISYHTTEENASINNAALTSPYLSTQNNETIYVRIENTISGCFITDTFQLITIPGPLIATPTPLTVCDNDNDGDDTNGFVSFLLRDKDNEILNGLDPVNYIITYHPTLANANAGTGVIDKNTPFTNTSNPQTIFVRAQHLPSHPCVNSITVVQLNLEVDSLPVGNPTSLIQCDEYLDSTDGITLFNLNQAITQITGGAANRTVLFFEDLVSANAGTPTITNTITYQNTTINQQLFTRITNDNSGCFRISTLDLEVSVTSANDAILRQCDDDGTEDGFREFDLSLADSQILRGIATPGLIVTYYQTIDDALSESNPITTTINSTPLTQGQDIVFARVENLNQCFGINQVQLFLNPLPDIETEVQYFLCQNQTNIEIDSGLPLNTNATNFSFLWSTNETTQTILASQPGIYTAQVTNTITGCSKSRTVEVVPSGSATIESIEINDARENNTVTINSNGLGDYEYAIELNGIVSSYQDESTFSNVPPGFHRIHIRDKNGCLPITIQDISVIGFPKYFTPNGDGFHETWNVKGISAQIMSGSLIFIYDRYGKLLKQLGAGTPGWDGTLNGKVMPSSEYWFRVELEDGRIITGSFSLIR